MDFPNCRITIRLPLTNMTLRKGPFSIRVLHHRKVYPTIHSLKYKTTGGNLGTMTFAFAFIPARGNRRPRRVGGRYEHVRLLALKESRYLAQYPTDQWSALRVLTNAQQ